MSKECDGCGDPSKPTVNNEAKECCELYPANCVVTSEYQNFFKIGVGKTLTFVVNTIAKFVKALKLRVDALESQVASVRPYKVYTARVTQGGVVAPDDTIMENTLSATPVWGYANPGEYNLTLVGEFPVDKTWVIATNENSLQDVVIYRNDDDVICLFTASGTDGNVHANVEIRVYD